MMKSHLFKPADAAPLAAYRILMGILMAAEGWGAILTGWVAENYVNVPFTFNFIGFDFLQILVGNQAYFVYFLLGLFGIGIALGYRYRAMAIGYAILWSAVYFGQKSSYNNHYYLLMLVCILMAAVPANVFASLDVKLGRIAKSDYVENWNIWVFKFLLLIVYSYAAIAKLYPDWMDGTTVGIFFSGKSSWAVLGPLFDQYWFIMLISWGGIIFDLLVIPALWYKPTRKYAFILSLFFHGFNSIAFQIGIFPFMMLITTILYFDPKTIRKLFFKGKSPENDQATIAFPSTNKHVTAALIACFMGIQILLPLRPYYFPGSSHWTEAGHRLSWHMMLRSKSGNIHFIVRDPSANFEEYVYPSRGLPSKLARNIATRPDIAWQYAQKLAQDYSAQGYENIEVYARSSVRLNGREPAMLIDPEVDLAREKWNRWNVQSWILPHPEL